MDQETYGRREKVLDGFSISGKTVVIRELLYEHLISNIAKLVEIEEANEKNRITFAQYIFRLDELFRNNLESFSNISKDVAKKLTWGQIRRAIWPAFLEVNEDFLYLSDRLGLTAYLKERTTGLSSEKTENLESSDLSRASDDDDDKRMERAVSSA